MLAPYLEKMIFKLLNVCDFYLDVSLILKNIDSKKLQAWSGHKFKAKHKRITSIKNYTFYDLKLY
jgi:hypothetical protein